MSTQSTQTRGAQAPPPLPTIREIALSLTVKRGMFVIPVPPLKKSPDGNEWQHQRLTVEDIPLHFKEREQNIGGLVGVAQEGWEPLADVDLDCPEAIRLAAYFLPDTYAKFGRKSKPRSHLLFRTPKPITTQQYEDTDGTTIVERRGLSKKGTPQQTIMPGSWRGRDPKKDPPDYEPELVRWDEDGEATLVDADELCLSLAELAAAALIVRHYPNNRHKFHLALSGALLRAGWSKDKVRHLAEAVVRVAKDDELDNRLACVDDTYETLNKGGEATGWPQVAKMVGQAVVDKLWDWLDIEPTTPTAQWTIGNRPKFKKVEPKWPAPPGDAAFMGFAGEVVDAISPHTEADRVALLNNLLTAFGCAVGRGPHALVGATVHALNIFSLLVGDTSRGRKGDSWPPVKVIFEAADPLWTSTRIQSGISSGEGLISAVRDPVVKLERNKKTGEYEEVVVDEGVNDKRLLVFEPEFARFLQAKTRQGNTVSGVSRDAWDRGTLQSMTKVPMRATNAHIAIVGHITSDELRRDLTATDTANGFANRFITLMVKRSKELPEPEPFVGQPVIELGKRLQTLLEKAKTVGLMHRDEAARELWRSVYSKLTEEHKGLAWAIMARAEAQVLRLSLIYALMDGSPVVRVPHLQAALELWGYSERSVLYIFGDAIGDPTADTILTALRSGGSLTRTQISNIFARHADSNEIERALLLLASHRLAAMLETPSSGGGGGRPVQTWMAVERAYN